MLATLLAIALHAYDLDVTTSRLDNGMTVLVARDASVNDVAVELWFRAGSSDELPGQSGIAHLFEHVLPGPRRVFTANENRAAFRRDYLDSNGSTSTDYTNMFARVPATSVELAIATFADRATASADTITEKELNANREIVAGEFRNSSGRAWDPVVVNAVRRVLFGSTRPYGHAVLGTKSDVDAVSVDTIRRWFASHYGASNTMLVVIGNADPAQVIALAKKHFGAMPSGDAMPLALPPVLPRTRRTSMDVSAPQAARELQLAWTTPAWGDPARQHVAIAKEFLRRDLEKTLRCDVKNGDGFAGSAGGETSLRILCTGDVTDRALSALDRFLASNPDIATVRDDRLASIASDLTRLGWRESRAQLLGEGFWLAGDARAYLQQISAIENATTAKVMTAAKKWLTNPLIVHVSPAIADATAVDHAAALSLPFPTPSTATDVIDEDHVVTVQRPLPVVLGRIVTPTSVDEFTAVPSRAAAALAKALEGRTRANLSVIVVGDLPRSVVARAVASLPPGSFSAAPAPPPDPPRFTPVPGATQTTLTAIASYDGADPARVAVAADLLRGRLNNRIREQEHWSYDVDVRADGTTIRIETKVRDDVATKAADVVRGQLQSLPNEKLTDAEAARAQGAELRRLSMLGSAPGDLADALVAVARSGLAYGRFVALHQSLLASLQPGSAIGISAPTRVAFSASGDPGKVDAKLRE